MEFIQSVENYKGYELTLVMRCDYSHPSLYHKNVIVAENGVEKYHCKSKKEAKALIDADIFHTYEKIGG